MAPVRVRTTVFLVVTILAITAVWLAACDQGVGPTPSPIPKATATKEPSHTPTTTPSATATPTPRPTATSTATSTPRPTVTATATPEPSNTPTFTPSPEPTSISTVTPTPAPIVVILRKTDSYKCHSAECVAEPEGYIVAGKKGYLLSEQDGWGFIELIPAPDYTGPRAHAWVDSGSYVKESSLLEAGFEFNESCWRELKEGEMRIGFSDQFVVCIETEVAYTRHPLTLNLDGHEYEAEIFYTSAGDVVHILDTALLAFALPSDSSTTPSLQATFDGPTCEWNVSDTPGFKSGCLEGEYQVLIKQAGQDFYTVVANLSSADFSLSADVRFASSVYGVAALIFNVNARKEFYIFALGSSGSYGLWTQGAGWQTLVGWTPVPNFDATGTNRVRVEREGAVIRLYLNDQLLTTVNDTTLISPNLGVGVYMQSYFRPNLDVRWDNFAAYPLGSPP